MINKYWVLESLYRATGNTNSMEPIYNVYRVLKLKELGFGLESTPEDLMYGMYSANSFPPFKGDARNFYEIFKIISGFTVEGCIDYIEYIRTSQKKSSATEFMIPDSLAKIMMKSITNRVSKIYIPDCEKYGIAFYNLISSYSECKFYTSCVDADLKKLYQLLYAHLNVEFINADIYREDFVHEKFDIIICFPIMGGRSLIDKSGFISNEPALIAAQNLLYHLFPDGNLTIVLPAKVTFGGGDVQYFRDYIDSNYKINEISSLPNKLFYPYMAINTYLFNFSNGVTEDIILRKYSLEKNNTSVLPKLIVEDEKLYFEDEFRSLNGWSIDMAFNSNDEEILNFTESRVKKNQLKDVATLFRGRAITEKADDGNIAIINISDISDTGIDYSNLYSINEEERKISRYILEEDDVLITARGTTVKIAVFKEQTKICIPSSNIIVARTNKLLKGAYLKLFLESKVGSKMLKNLQRGATIVNINYQDVEMIEVPVPPMEKQEEVVANYEAGLDLYKKTVTEAEKAWKKIQAVIEDELY